MRTEIIVSRGGEWVGCKFETPPEGVVVMTAIIDERGERMRQELKRVGGLWFVPNGSMYVYYEPTHWLRPFAQTGVRA